MLTFRQYLEERFKSEHEPYIRLAASLGRRAYTKKNESDIDDNKDLDRRTYYGDCDGIAHHTCSRLRKKYPSARVMYSHNPKGLIYPHDKSLTGHAWVEIPEINHYVDPSHDMFKNISPHRKNIPNIKGRYPDNAVKIGKMDKDYHKTYTGKKVSR